MNKIYMKIFEARGKIDNIKDARDTAEKIGAVYKGFYSCTDFIFETKNVGEILRLRVFKINNRQTKNHILTHKIPEWSGNIKTDKIILQNKFDTIREAINFMIDHYGDFKEDYEYSRDGWEYSHNKNDIFIENIEKLGPTIEIEAENKDDLENLLKSFDISEIFSESTPEIMRKLQKHSN